MSFGPPGRLHVLMRLGMHHGWVPQSPWNSPEWWADDASTPVPPVVMPVATRPEPSTVSSRNDSYPDYEARNAPRESTPPTSRIGSRLRRALAPLAGLGALLAKLKAFVFLGSMAISVAAYTTIWGWKFAVGFVLLILVHELGHVAAMRARGIKSGLPVFLPFLGAFVSMKSQPQSVYEEAESAFAGPLTGTVGAALVAYLGHVEGSSLLRSLAFTGFFLSLFNLLPIVPFDGGRVAKAFHVSRNRGHEVGESRPYFEVTPGQRTRVVVSYVLLIVFLLYAMHLTYLHRTIS